MTTVILLALALSMDAFAASLSQGAASRPSATLAGALRIGATFGSAQAFMPLLGWALGLVFASLIRNIDHWIAFALLAAIGGRMVHASGQILTLGTPAHRSARGGKPTFGDRPWKAGARASSPRQQHAMPRLSN